MKITASHLGEMLEGKWRPASHFKEQTALRIDPILPPPSTPLAATAGPPQRCPRVASLAFACDCEALRSESPLFGILVGPFPWVLVGPSHWVLVWLVPCALSPEVPLLGPHTPRCPVGLPDGVLGPQTHRIPQESVNAPNKTD